MKKFYVTTPIYYATAAPHLGTLYSTILADVAARWYRIRGYDVRFLTGTDEFGQKVAQAAFESGKHPQEFVDMHIDAYKNLWKAYNIQYTDFMRTTSKFHVDAVQKWIKKLQDQGDIYKGIYKGWYCTPCETFLTEKESGAIENPLCITCDRSTNLVGEECYFFRLSAYQDRLLDFYRENSNFIFPKERFAEVIKFVEGGLQDLSISRTTISWGVPFPDDDRHVAYVWADALNNYITAIGYMQQNRESEFAYWWPADLQVLGKDILRFHAVHWPAFLMASGLLMPKKLLVHGWIKVGDYKMSKSRGNSINPQDLLEKYGADAVRYYLVRQMAVTQDGNFTIEDLESKINTDLVNDIGNLVQRLIILAHKNNIHEVTQGSWTIYENNLYDCMYLEIQEINDYMERGLYHMALSGIWKLINATNTYFHSQEPWKVVKKDVVRFMTILHCTSSSLYLIAHFLWPFMPEKADQLLSQLSANLVGNIDIIVRKNEYFWERPFILVSGSLLFNKCEIKVALSDGENMVQDKEVTTAKDLVSIEDFVKIELSVGTIIASSIVAGSDKLLRLQVDCGDKGIRIIFSGVRKYYDQNVLIGKQAVFVTNLKPRKMMGEESQGMMLFVKDKNDVLQFVEPCMQVENGAVLS